ncbi:hypothetical protein DFP72DRAFT_990059 [Ephemerocybe angulata]|uniref:CxC2-like cysteine cluster KDZ transposase-associated domain-containing protein n=1 Tax=Ephemerocybe angulata TaxID=980116 RepID=A0A8H6HYT1_9AGAR|nr:hypothetical protein DFP72DRAFT_990059 [Tulosesus angulatus]
MNRKPSAGKRKQKLAGHLSIPGASSIPKKHDSAASRTLRTLKMKANPQTGRYKVYHGTQMSTVNVPNVSMNDSRTTEEILKAWLLATQTHGWEQSYVDSFLDNEQRPPESDPEVTSRTKGMGEIDSYLRVILTLEGRGVDPPSTCAHCTSEAPPIYRCLVCYNGGLMCESCIRTQHTRLPTHRIQRWNGIHFTQTTLKAVGLRIQLGHPPGERCPLSESAWADDFVIVDCDAVHNVGLDFCRCGATSKSHVEQLLERRLYPATVSNPKTAATFRALELFELFQYEAKISPFEFFKAIARLTDNTGLNPVKDRYPSVLRMVHEWRHLKLLKRMGRGHDPLRGASATTQGECALLCPACPHPGINMPEGWENEPEETRWIHALNLALDANFRLRRKDVSTNAADPGLSEGFAYFVEDKAFSKYVKQHADEVEPKSTCSRHDAVNLADTRPGQGYSATGVATVECAHHNMKRPSAVCDLQKGERYSNMDYILHWSLVVLALGLLRTFIISYDIACQWSINLMRRLKAIDDKSPLLNEKVKTRYVVPKFHLPAHIAPCQSKFAFMLTPGAGLGDGEAPERGWADTNPLGPSTREMGPGTRRDTLDSHFGDYNWRKITDLGSSLLKKMNNAVLNVAEHVIAHQELEETLDSADVERWKLTMANWEKDPKNPSPFEMIVETPTQKVVRRVMADDETEALKTGMDFSLSSEISPSALISRGLDLEAEQRALKSQMKQVWTHSQDRELTRLQLRSNALIRKIESWYEILQLYIPSSVILRKQQSAQVSVQPYNLPLWLPSEIGSRAICDRRLIEIEYDLRIAQAQEALTNVKRHLQRRARWLRGQGANTRALSLLGSIEDRISTARDEYRQSRLAIISLEKVLGHSGGERCYPPFGRCRHSTDGTGRTGRPQKTERSNPPNALVDMETRGCSREPNINTLAVRVEWGKSKARATRYQEEVLIVREEMNRTSRFLQWRESQWRERGASWATEPVPTEYLEGLKAYAERQANMFQGLRSSFEHKWTGVDKTIAYARAEIAEPELFYQRRQVEIERAKNNNHIFSAPLAAGGGTDPGASMEH